jgi:hypothetical protein
MSDCKSCSTPIDTQAKLSDVDGASVSDVTTYQSLTGALQYLTFTRPDIAYAVQQMCLHMHTSREPHLTTVKRILRYLRSSLDFGLLRPFPTSELVVYTDADGLAATTRVGPPLATSCSWASTLSPDPRNGSSSSPALALMSSIALWPMAWPKFCSFVSFFVISTAPSCV